MSQRVKQILRAVLLGFIMVSITYAIFRETKHHIVNPEGAQPKTTLKHQLIAYYFHGNARCQSCLKIENYSADTIRSKFGDQLKTGVLQWKVINVEEQENSHYVQDYKLYTKSVVLVELVDGKQVQWKNLEKVWDYLGEPKQFSAYIEAELKKWL